ncbi:MAG: imidazolonepropionase [Desulfobacteraceae bacterium 4572_130]|nr:MAG: imidazolonepropionase [Desulfobacteraceae bacterium 4572_130]
MNNNNVFPQIVDLLFINANIATMTKDCPYGAIENGAVGIYKSKIAWVGKMKDMPFDFTSRAFMIHNANGAWITPGLIDCHTHIIYGGSRTKEFELRLNGVSYKEIALQGGGIISTVKSTRKAKISELFQASAKRLKALLAQGITTIEIKSGYGLDLETELKMLKIAKMLEHYYPVTVKTTYLGAHAIPPEFKKDKQGYIDFICNNALPRIKKQKLADFVDAFCEKIAFSEKEITKIFKKALQLGFPVKLHADQLSDSNGGKLAAKFNALSADHLEYSSEKSIIAMKKAKVTAVLLPGAFYYLKEKKIPPIEILRKHKLDMAVSTDSNPGSSPVLSILLMMNMACINFGLTPEEALLGVTKNGAKALGLLNSKGTIESGKDADLVLWDIKEPGDLAYSIGYNPCIKVIQKGIPIS